MRFLLPLLCSFVLIAQASLEATKADARKLFQAGALETSAELWQQALQLAPEDLEVRLNYGIALDALGRYREANQQLTAAARIRATIPVLNNLAVNLVHLERREEAAQLLRHVLEADPHNVSALYNLGRLDLARGRWEEAIRNLSEAAKAPNADGTIRASLGAAQRGWADQLLRENRIADSISHFQAALELTPDDPSIYLGAVVAMVRGNDTESALAVLDEAARRFPSEVRVPVALGYVYEDRSEWTKAEAAYRKALSIDEESLFARVFLGRALRLEGQQGSAVTLLRSAAERNPRSAVACYEFATTLLASNPASPEGMQWMKVAADLSPASSEPRYAMAKAALAQGDVGEAQHWARLAAASDPKSAPPHFLLATIYRRQGKPDAAASEAAKFSQLRKEVHSSQDPELEQLLQGAIASR